MPALSFQINLTGNFTAQLKPANEQLRQTEGHAKKAAHGLEVFELEAGKLQATIGGLGMNLASLGKGGVLFTFDLAEGLSKVFELGKKVVETVVELGKEMFKAAATSQDLDLALKLSIGPEAAERVNAVAESFKNTRFAPEQIKSALLPLTAQGISDAKLLDDMATAATDLAATKNEGIAGVQSHLEAFAKISLRGEVNAKMLQDLRVNQHSFYQNLGNLLHTSEEGAKKLSGAGLVKGATLLSVALDEIAKKQGGAIGRPSLEAAKTIGAEWDRLKALPERYFARLANSPALGSLSNALERALAALDPDSPTGARIMASLDRLLGKIVNIVDELATPEGMDSLAKGIDQAVQGAGTLVEVFKEALSVVSRLMSFGDQLAKMGDDIAAAIGGPGAIAERARANQERLLAQLQGQAQANHFLGMMNAGAEAVGGGSAMSMIPGLPHMAAGGIVDSPTVALIGESGPEAVVPLGKGGGRGVSISVGEVIVHMSGGDTARATEAGQTVRFELMKFVREASAQFGVDEG